MTVLTLMPVANSVTEISAPGNTAPDGSLTVPRRTDSPVWAITNEQAKSSSPIELRIATRKPDVSLSILFGLLFELMVCSLFRFITASYFGLRFLRRETWRFPRVIGGWEPVYNSGLGFKSETTLGTDRTAPEDDARAATSLIRR